MSNSRGWAAASRLAALLAVVAAAGCGGIQAGQHVAVAPADRTDAPAVSVTANRTFTTIAGRPRYRVGPGDELTVAVRFLGDVETDTLPVESDGTLVTRYGAIHVDGLTPEEIEERVLEAARPYVREPKVSVRVARYRSRTVTLLGAMGVNARVGEIPLEGRTTVVQLLARAGALGPQAQLDRVILHRADGERLTVNVYALLTGGDLSQDPVLDGGDTVYVPGALADEARRVFVLGEVRNPGAYPYTPGLTVSRLVASAGGLSEVAVPQSIRVIRGGREAPRLVAADFRRILEDGDRSGDPPMQPNDIVYVPRSLIGDWNAFLGKIRPTLEILTLPLDPIIQYEILRQLR